MSDQEEFDFEQEGKAFLENLQNFIPYQKIVDKYYDGKHSKTKAIEDALLADRELLKEFAVTKNTEEEKTLFLKKAFPIIKKKFSKKDAKDMLDKQLGKTQPSNPSSSLGKRKPEKKEVAPAKKKAAGSMPSLKSVDEYVDNPRQRAYNEKVAKQFANLNHDQQTLLAELVNRQNLPEKQVIQIMTSFAKEIGERPLIYEIMDAIAKRKAAENRYRPEKKSESDVDPEEELEEKAPDPEEENEDVLEETPPQEVLRAVAERPDPPTRAAVSSEEEQGPPKGKKKRGKGRAKSVKVKEVERSSKIDDPSARRQVTQAEQKYGRQKKTQETRIKAGVVARSGDPIRTTSQSSGFSVGTVPQGGIPATSGKAKVDPDVRRKGTADIGAQGKAAREAALEQTRRAERERLKQRKQEKIDSTADEGLGEQKKRAADVPEQASEPNLFNTSINQQTSATDNKHLPAKPNKPLEDVSADPNKPYTLNNPRERRNPGVQVQDLSTGSNLSTREVPRESVPDSVSDQKTKNTNVQNYFNGKLKSIALSPENRWRHRRFFYKNFQNKVMHQKLLNYWSGGKKKSPQEIRLFYKGLQEDFGKDMPEKEKKIFDTIITNAMNDAENDFKSTPTDRVVTYKDTPESKGLLARIREKAGKFLGDGVRNVEEVVGQTAVGIIAHTVGLALGETAAAALVSDFLVEGAYLAVGDVADMVEDFISDKLIATANRPGDKKAQEALQLEKEEEDQVVQTGKSVKEYLASTKDDPPLTSTDLIPEDSQEDRPTQSTQPDTPIQASPSQASQSEIPFPLTQLTGPQTTNVTANQNGGRAAVNLPETKQESAAVWDYTKAEPKHGDRDETGEFTFFDKAGWKPAPDWYADMGEPRIGQRDITGYYKADEKGWAPIKGPKWSSPYAPKKGDMSDDGGDWIYDGTRWNISPSVVDPPDRFSVPVWHNIKAPQLLDKDDTGKWIYMNGWQRNTGESMEIDTETTTEDAHFGAFTGAEERKKEKEEREEREEKKSVPIRNLDDKEPREGETGSLGPFEPIPSIESPLPFTDPKKRKRPVPRTSVIIRGPARRGAGVPGSGFAGALARSAGAGGGGGGEGKIEEGSEEEEGEDEGEGDIKMTIPEDEKKAPAGRPLTDRDRRIIAEAKRMKPRSFVPRPVVMPMLRPEFPEGSSAIVEGVNQDKTGLMLDRLMWQTFKNYQWEANEEADNALYAGIMGEQNRRFGYTKPSDPLGNHNRFARELIKSSDIDVNMFKLPANLRHKARFIGYPDDEYDGKGKFEGPVNFHDVFLPDWASVPESHPLNQFTATNGCQIPDSERLAGGKFSSYDWDSLEGTNQFIFSTLT